MKKKGKKENSEYRITNIEVRKRGKRENIEYRTKKIKKNEGKEEAGCGSKAALRVNF